MYSIHDSCSCSVQKLGDACSWATALNASNINSDEERHSVASTPYLIFKHTKMTLQVWIYAKTWHIINVFKHSANKSIFAITNTWYKHNTGSIPKMYHCQLFHSYSVLFLTEITHGQKTLPNMAKNMFLMFHIRCEDEYQSTKTS